MLMRRRRHEALPPPLLLRRELISISTRLLFVSLGFLSSRLTNFAETYEVPAPESANVRHVVPSTFAVRTGNTPSPLPLAVIIVCLPLFCSDV